MHDVGMDMLLSADGEVQSLKGKGPPPVELAQQVDDGWICGNAADIVVLFPGVPHPETGRLSGAVIVPFVVRLQRLPDILSHPIEVGFREGNDREAVTFQIRGYRSAIDLFRIQWRGR